MHRKLRAAIFFRPYGTVSGARGVQIRTGAPSGWPFAAQSYVAMMANAGGVTISWTSNRGGRLAFSASWFRLTDGPTAT